MDNYEKWMEELTRELARELVFPRELVEKKEPEPDSDRIQFYFDENGGDEE